MYTSYRLFQHSPTARDTSDLGLGVIHLDLGVWTLAKHTKKCAYTVFNEATAVDLGVAAGVPIVEGTVFSKVTLPKPVDIHEAECWGSFLLGEELPEYDPGEALKDMPEHAAQILAFDAWICNNDRGPENLWYDAIEKRLLAFDHGAGICSACGLVHLVDQENDLDCLKKHCFAGHIVDGRTLWLGISKIQEVHDQVVLHSVRRNASLLPNDVNWMDIANQLISRKKKLQSLFVNAILFDRSCQNHDEKLFPSLATDLLTESILACGGENVEDFCI